jgi:hypothetical protein
MKSQGFITVAGAGPTNGVLLADQLEREGRA